MRILFVCVGNTCRSQMAQAAARHMGYEAESAGTHPGGEIAANAIKVTFDLGIEMEDQYPKSVDEIDTAGFDRIISMGCGVECPTLPIDEDWGLDDPVGREEKIYRATLDEILGRIETLEE
ncbi:MAG: arsenate reductase ArsC [Candidatus Thermoplasmatota archaeon]|nr:arsenate reductase ArsC [Candidatus Thermoplasmatota archaeon]